MPPGPATWAKSFPLAAGKKQSPIDIDPSSASKQAGSALVASYNPATSNTLTNTGLSFQVSVDGSKFTLALFVEICLLPISFEF